MSGGMGQQATAIQYLQGSSSAGATANGNGTPALTDGFNGALQLEVVESGGGTCTLTLQGSFDGGSNWDAVGYQQVDGVATLARAVSALSVTANMKHVYQLLDPYPQVRAVVSAVAGGCAVMVRLYMVPA
jgi:hypothetical protein